MMYIPIQELIHLVLTLNFKSNNYETVSYTHLKAVFYQIVYNRAFKTDVIFVPSCLLQRRIGMPLSGKQEKLSLIHIWEVPATLAFSPLGPTSIMGRREAGET